ncbi:ATP-dependent metallopeptidase FtsH/Yme1/Tma family protein [Irregularibacter muris]|uniref:ATP-dependent zinc metalloprotease FtsH n=1 Tax=Irregularibacter muris TaxID=1796619 RepID=A0AAE3KZD9_9FIRM|nr:FtsH/Yme1/Tma family ATP-dependent metallopeptidase [Irregularibacter muris]MCR1898576.1 ATP-dependent metallopeptidase FtsH/Yme1/Tma family protein [Irregularibacter muris]
MKKSYIFIAVSILVVLLISIAGYQHFQPKPKDMNYTTFVSHLEEGKVQEITIRNDAFLDVKMKDKSVFQVPNPQSESMKEYFLLNEATVTKSKVNPNMLLQVFLWVGVAVFAVFLLQKERSKDKMELVNANGTETKDETSYTFDHVAGNDEAKDMVKDIIDFIKDPEKYSKLGAKMPRGIMLYGPPGTGKTLIAKAIAGESGVPFYAVSGSDFIQMYVGVGASRIRQLFKKAKKSQKAVIFIDEIDAIGKKRADNPDQGNSERDQTLNALLTEMSGFSTNLGIVVVAATNRVDTLDEALLRPGRFDRLIEVGLPDVNARRRILGLHVQNKPLNNHVDLDQLARDTVYFSGAMLESLANEAAILAANENSTEIYQRHLNQAFYTVVAGSEKKDRSSIHKEDMEITAYHESGHALATKLLLPKNTISKVTIIPSTKGYGGFNLSIPEDRLYRTKQNILKDIKVLLAGRAAEELIFGLDNITTGASNDIERASRHIKEYVMKLGMDSDIGLFNNDAVNMNADPIILEKCREYIKELYQEVKGLLNDNLDILHALTQKLMEKETIGGDDIDILLGSKIA